MSEVFNAALWTIRYAIVLGFFVIMALGAWAFFRRGGE